MKKILFLCLMSLLISCGDDDSNGTSQSYNGPGSVWTLTETTAGYDIEVTEDNGDTISISATSSTLSNGFIELTVASASATGSASAPSVGEKAHAVEIPGVAFLLKPVDPNGETVPMVSAGSCPSSNFDANWIIGGRGYTSGDIVSGTKDWFGDISWDTSSGQATFTNQFDLETKSSLLGSPSVQTIGTCSGGMVQTSNINAYFTAAGVAIVQTNVGQSDESHIIGVPQGAISDITESYGEYIGFYFENLSGGDETHPATMTLTSDSSNHQMILNTLSGTSLTTSSLFDTIDFTTSDVNSPANGFVSGQFENCVSNGGDGTCQITCAGAGNVNGSGKTMIYCVGQHPSDEDRRITLLFISK